MNENNQTKSDALLGNQAGLTSMSWDSFSSSFLAAFSLPLIPAANPRPR